MLKFIESISNACGKIVTAPLVILRAICNIMDKFDHKQGYDINISSNQKDHNDWNKIGEDMWRSIFRYDQELTQEKQEK